DPESFADLDGHDTDPNCGLTNCKEDPGNKNANETQANAAEGAQSTAAKQQQVANPEKQCGVLCRLGNWLTGKDSKPPAAVPGRLPPSADPTRMNDSARTKPQPQQTGPPKPTPKPGREPIIQTEKPWNKMTFLEKGLWLLKTAAEIVDANSTSVTIPFVIYLPRPLDTCTQCDKRHGST
ncbi:MAG: hypothetical protein ACLP1Y_07765, partial [Candidatus Acidiferrales bacterium]